MTYRGPGCALVTCLKVIKPHAFPAHPCSSLTLVSGAVNKVKVIPVWQRQLTPRVPLFSTLLGGAERLPGSGWGPLPKPKVSEATFPVEVTLVDVKYRAFCFTFRYGYVGPATSGFPPQCSLSGNWESCFQVNRRDYNVPTFCGNSNSPWKDTLQSFPSWSTQVWTHEEITKISIQIKNNVYYTQNC